MTEATAADRRTTHHQAGHHEAGHHETWVRAAAWNNAQWCAAMLRAHRSPTGGTFTDSLWHGETAPPPLYPDTVTLSPGATAAAALAGIDAASTSPSVKDSYAALDLTGQGFSRLFDAQWLLRDPDAPVAPPRTATWFAVRDEAELAAWASAWDSGQGLADLFRPRLLAEPDVAVLAGWSDGRIVAGAVANRSSAVAEVVGISNLFAVDGPPDDAWRGALTAMARLWPGRPVVGYEHGDELTTALAQGFTPVGPLTVWIRW
ncbi:hypothetical protein [Streptacidiphilus sp. EB129]|uniref:hypothetical protein n=1 Tax=Streptacidiphilus sp. EB129 TaxID=3156262 RepID=UPI0035149047